MQTRARFRPAFVATALLFALALMLQPIIDGSSLLPVPGSNQAAADKGGGDDDHGKGHSDENDNSGPGKRNDDENGNNGKGEGKGKGREKDKPEKKDKKVKPIENYTVDVGCTYASGSDQTSCTFSGLSPYEDEITFVLVPVDAACVDLAEGATPVSGSLVDGYQSDTGDSRLELVFAGPVDTAGQAVYWVLTDEGLYPATGQGLACNENPATEAPPTPTPQQLQPVATVTPTPASVLTPITQDETGSIVVEARTCPLASAPERFDWFGQCSPAPSGVTFELTDLASATGEPRTLSTDDSGNARFENLSPGKYDLIETTADWCHAESDSVNDLGQIVVQAGMLSTVWIFNCDGDGGS
jgi:hypothetical protein